MWRFATPADDDAIIEMCLALNEEDPGPEPVSATQVRRTLAVLRAEPSRGHPVVSEVAGRIAGYALLIAFWSNELGGEVCTVDELYVQPVYRHRGLGAELFQLLLHDDSLWSGNAVAVGLEVSPDNVRALDWYRRLGFSGRNLALHIRRKR